MPSRLRIELETPKDPRHGDFTTNVAMRLAKHFSISGVKLAGLLKEEFGRFAGTASPGSVIERIEVSPPGFVNFWFNRKYLREILESVCEEGDAFGRSSTGRRQRVNIEFVSANPTGPLTVAHGRQASVGDALGRILRFCGYRVTREYFINDVGVQVELLGKSIYSHYLSLCGIDSGFPEEGYRGEYIKEIAEDLKKKCGKKFTAGNKRDIAFMSRFGVKHILKSIKGDLKKFGVFFDRWFSQRSLSHAAVKRALGKLRVEGYIYDKDGATWFKSTALGDDKDRVVIKSDGSFTYLAPDIAYHLNKFRRRFDRLVDIWGPDHHGYIGRLKAAGRALGYGSERLSLLIVQLATLYRNGVALSMSTRKGEFITLREVMDEVGCDVAKFFFLMRKLDSHLDFDLEVAKKNSLDNPVYYIQYAHARIASILKFSKNVTPRLKKEKCGAGRLDQPEERALLRMLAQFPLIVQTSARMLEPFRIVEYLNDLAKIFHNFYTKHRVVSESDPSLTKARLGLVMGVKVVLANGLRLLGVSFPERM